MAPWRGQPAGGGKQARPRERSTRRRREQARPRGAVNPPEAGTGAAPVGSTRRRREQARPRARSTRRRRARDLLEPGAPCRR